MLCTNICHRDLCLCTRQGLKAWLELFGVILTWICKPHLRNISISSLFPVSAWLICMSTYGPIDLESLHVYINIFREYMAHCIITQKCVFFNLEWCTYLYFINVFTFARNIVCILTIGICMENPTLLSKQTICKDNVIKC